MYIPVYPAVPIPVCSVAAVHPPLLSPFPSLNHPSPLTTTPTPLTSFPPISVPSPWVGSSGAYHTEHAHTRQREDSRFCSASLELASLDLMSLESLTQDSSFQDVFTCNGVCDEGSVLGTGYHSKVSRPPDVQITTASPYNAHPGFSISPNSAHLDMYLPGVDYPEFSTLSNGSALPDCLTVCSNGYTTPNMAWDSSPQSTFASEALTRGAAPTNTHPPVVTEADSAHYCNSPELLRNSEVSTDHGPKLNSSLLKLLLTPKSTTGTSSS